LAVLVGVVLLNELAFRTWLDTDYFRWYLDNGAVIGFVFTLVTLAWGDINRNGLLISANPLEYAASSLMLVTVPWFSLAAMIRPDRKVWKAERDFEEAQRQWKEQLPEARRAMEQLAASTSSEEVKRMATEWVAQSLALELPDSEDTPAPGIVPTGLPVVDILLALLFALAFVLASIAWLLLVVPVQYFVYLVTGAPARVASASPTRATVDIEGTRTTFGEDLKSDPLPKGAIESGFTAKPVSFTAAITTAVLFVASQVVT
jgi:hypothetical protein